MVWEQQNTSSAPSLKLRLTSNSSDEGYFRMAAFPNKTSDSVVVLLRDNWYNSNVKWIPVLDFVEVTVLNS